MANKKKKQRRKERSKQREHWLRQFADITKKQTLEQSKPYSLDDIKQLIQD